MRQDPFESLSFEPLKDLFDFQNPNAVDTLRKQIADKIQSDAVASGETVQIQLDVEDPSAIIVKQVDPKAAAGYLVFQDESQYNSWLNAQLFEPSQEQMMEALGDGAGS